MSSKRKPKAAGQIDLTTALEAPLKVKQGGEVRSIHPHEAVLRQHVKKALADGSVPSMKVLIAEAEKHKLIKPTPGPPQGGVFVVPKGLPEEVERAIFDERPGGDAMEPMSRIWGILKTFFASLRRATDGE